MISTGSYQGYATELNGAAFNCPALKLYGYATPRALESAIRREIKKRAARTQPSRPTYAEQDPVYRTQMRDSGHGANLR